MEERIPKQIDQIETELRRRCSGCDDIIIRAMEFGTEVKVKCLAVYIEAAAEDLMLEDSVLGKLIKHLLEMDEIEIYHAVSENSLGISDTQELRRMQECMDALLAGNMIFFLDGYNKALKIGTKGYPGMGVTQADSEKVLRGSREAFAESVKTNTALVRKRIRTTKLKVEELTAGKESHTQMALVYLEDQVSLRLLEEIRKRLEQIEIKGILDSGVVEQLTADVWYSPFPQFQTTERPDRAAAALLDGRILLLCDNTPMALLLPTTLNYLLQTGDDYYGHFEIASLLRSIRYLAVILAFSFPGGYLAVTNFHPQLLPTNLLLSMAEARNGVPFPAMAEVLLMEGAFELMREAGLRMPGSLGSMIGIVGGLIIGDAAVSANLVSPMIVIVVAVTALGSFSIPNEELSEAFRLLKYGMILLCGFFGIYGFAVGWLFLLIHLSNLKSFGIPYLLPFAAAQRSGISRWKDGIFRAPMRRLETGQEQNKK